ncbi:MAG: hypothetical protein CFE34_03580 [Rhodobacteraceae bacterium PARR1]|nr:MAG: hypothetical protein CFE34_03580 [Rhodobacteraceae bacterium PARR1]
MARSIGDVAVIAPHGDTRAAEVADWLDAQGVAHVRVQSVEGSALVLRVGQDTVSGEVEEITRQLQDLLWRNLQS